MTTSSFDQRVHSPLGAFLLLLLVIFIGELIIMELIMPLCVPCNRVASSLLDATFLTLLLVPVFWCVVIKPAIGGQEGSRPSIAALAPLLKVLLSVFMVEFLVMLILPLILPSKTMERDRNIADAALTAALCAPLLWELLFRPMSEKQRESVVNFMLTPAKLFTVLLVAVFAVHNLEELISSIFVTGSYYGILTDSLLTTLLAAPILWYLVARPLKLMALAEKSHSDAIRAQVVDAIVTIDGTEIVQSINPAAERIFGCSSEEIVGAPFAQLFRDSSLPSNGLLLNRDVAPGATLALKARTRKGVTLFLEISISSVILAGKQQFVVIVRDITARAEAEIALRESEQRFRQIFEQTEDAVILFKPGTCQVIDVNLRAQTLFGFSKQELQDSGLECFSGSVDHDRMSSTISNVGQESRMQLENILVMRKDGSSLNVSMGVKLMKIQGVNLCYCTFRDITERIRLEQEARNIQAKLIQANKMTSLGLLVSGVAHEINNPNNFIMANSQLLAKIWNDTLKILRQYYREHGDFIVGGLPFSELDEQSQEMFAGIVDGTRRINHIVENLKNYARQDRRSEERPIDLNQVVKAALNMVNHEIKKHTTSFHLHLDDTIPAVAGNNRQLEQVVINLLMNACQALTSKDASVTLRTAYDSDTHQVKIIISDQGGGIAPESLSRIMEPFFTTKLDSGGTGLGLSICQSIVQEHNGRLECESELGEGTTFTVKLPAVRS